MNIKSVLVVKWTLRIGSACTFWGHGMNALHINEKWIPLLTVYGFSVEQAKMLMPLIGMVDIIIALFMLIYPARLLLLWAFCWAFATALTRFIAGEAIWEFIERGANWAAPLSLLLVYGMPVKRSDWLKVG